MKTIDLRPLDGTPPGQTPRDIIATVMGISPEGVQLTEVRKRLKVLDKLETADRTLELEDAEHATLQTAIMRFPFNLVTKFIGEACDRV
jgi:hypothetical protein